MEQGYPTDKKIWNGLSKDEQHKLIDIMNKDIMSGPLLHKSEVWKDYDNLNSDFYNELHNYINGIQKIKEINMKQEIKRIQELAGIKKTFDLDEAYKESPDFHSYSDVLSIIEQYESKDELDDFKTRFPENKDISKKDFFQFNYEYVDDMSEIAYIKANWVSITDSDVYEKADLI